MSDHDAIEALTSDLYDQLDEMKPRGLKNKAGRPYSPAHYMRGLENATELGGLAVADFVRRYVHKPPTESFAKLAENDLLDLACEWLVADETKPYAHLFTDDDRAAAKARLAPCVAAVEARRAGERARVDAARAKLKLDGMPFRSHLDLAQRGRPARRD